MTDQLNDDLFDQVRASKQLSGKSMRWFLFYVNVLSIFTIIFQPISMVSLYLSFVSQYVDGIRPNANGIIFMIVYFLHGIISEVLLIIGRNRLFTFRHSGYAAIMLMFGINILANIIYVALRVPQITSVMVAVLSMIPFVATSLNIIYFYKRRQLFTRA